ncbi:MAG: hypothetical protein IJV19_05760 [Prevotella sp.]|nr:hypothetical protein [Prevotella sp.]MBQ8457900.1 hypothetical protein [Prevotella sp.]
MANVTKIVVDEAVYEYSCFVWGLIAKENPKMIVTQLSEGKGVVSRNESAVQENLLKLITKAVLFVPRVRLSHDYGYRQENTRWYSALLNKKRSLRSKVVYLTDAVNQIIAKPYNEEIARLRQSISEEVQAQKDGKQLTPEQTAKVEEVNCKIAEQRKLLRGQPRCTNQILTTLLHEYVDALSAEDATAISSNMQEIASQEELISGANEKLKTQEFKDDSEKRLKVENLVAEATKRIEDCRKLCLDIRTKYYRQFHQTMTPQAIATQLTKYAATSWEAFNINLKMIEENIIIKSPAKPTKEEDGEKKISRKQPTLAELGEALLLFPYAIGDASLDDQTLADIANDLKVAEEYDRWAKEFKGKEYTSEYQQAYEGFRKRLRTLPEKKGSKKKEKSPDKSMTTSQESTVRLQPQAQQTKSILDSKEQVYKRNHEELLNYMGGLSRTLIFGKDFNDTKNREYMQQFAERPDFQTLFERLKSHESDYKKFSNPMQYIRNVVLHEQLAWSISPVQ